MRILNIFFELRRKATRKRSRGTEPEMSDWIAPRIFVGRLLDTTTYDVTVCSVVLFNCVLLWSEADHGVSCYGEEEACLPSAFAFANSVLLALYTLEVSLTVYVQRSLYLFYGWNSLDFTVVLFAYLELILERVSDSSGILSLVRLLKVLRVVRSVRLLRPIPQLYKLMVGIFMTVQTMFWGFVMILILLAAWSVVTIQVLTPLTDIRDTAEDEWCHSAFSSVTGTVLLYFQTLIAGDSWGRCFVPAMLKHPSLFLLFSGALVTVQLGCMNLILAVIVDVSAEMREAQVVEKAARVRENRDRTIHDLQDTLQSMDADQSGTISLAEFKASMKKQNHIKDRLDMLGISEGEIDTMFKLMDYDGLGHVSYDDFVDVILKAEDQHAQMMNLNLKLDSLTRSCKHSFAIFDHTLAELATRLNTQASSAHGSQCATPCLDEVEFQSHAADSEDRPRCDLLAAYTDRADLDKFSTTATEARSHAAADHVSIAFPAPQGYAEKSEVFVKV